VDRIYIPMYDMAEALETLSEGIPKGTCFSRVFINPSCLASSYNIDTNRMIEVRVPRTYYEEDFYGCIEFIKDVPVSKVSLV
jgi:hypothetical protein